MNVEHFLNDHFIEFSTSIAEIHAKGKALDTQFKEQLRAYKKAKEDLETSAKELVNKWEAQKTPESKKEKE